MSLIRYWRDYICWHRQIWNKKFSLCITKTQIHNIHKCFMSYYWSVWTIGASFMRRIMSTTMITIRNCDWWKEYRSNRNITTIPQTCRNNSNFLEMIISNNRMVSSNWKKIIRMLRMCDCKLESKLWNLMERDLKLLKMIIYLDFTERQSIN